MPAADCAMSEYWSRRFVRRPYSPGPRGCVSPFLRCTPRCRWTVYSMRSRSYRGESEMNLYMESLGDGPTVLLVHGWGLHGGVWRDLAARLARSFRVLVPDLPGHGRSRGMRTQASLAGLADDLSRRLTEPAIWIGWSLGAFVALATARNHPQAVSRSEEH